MSPELDKAVLREMATVPSQCTLQLTTVLWEGPMYTNTYMEYPIVIKQHFCDVHL